MGIVMTSGGVSKTYNYYPYDALYVDASGNLNANGNGSQVKEAWFNGVKYYPIGEKPSFRLELRFADSPHHFDKSDVAPYSRITSNRDYYQNFLDVDESQWIYSTLSISTFNPQRKQWGILTSYRISNRIVFPSLFSDNNNPQIFAYSIRSPFVWSEEGIDDSAYNISNWPNYYTLGNYDEQYYYNENDTVHTSRYYIHDGLSKCNIKPHVNWYKEDGQEVYFSPLLNSNRSYKFYAYSGNYPTADVVPRLIAEYSNGSLTVYDGYIYAVNVSASDEVARMLQHTGVGQMPTYNSH